MQRITINPQENRAPTRDLPPLATAAARLPPAKGVKVHPTKPGENASLFFVGTATTIMYVHASNPAAEANDTVNGRELD